MHRARFILLSLLLAPGALGAAAPPPAPPPASTPAPPPAPPVDELVAAALTRSPALAALRARAAASRTRERPAAALPDPMVEAAFQDAAFPRYTVGKDENSMLGLEVRQDLPHPGKRAARQAAARAETAERGAELARLERSVAAQVRTVYGRLYALDGEAASLAAARELLDLLAATARARYGAGQAEQESLLRAQVEVSRLDARLADLAARRAGQVAAMNRLLDRPGAEPLGRVAALTPMAPPAGSWEELAVAGSPEVAAAKAAVETAERRLRLARLDLKPDFSAAAGFGYRGGLDPMTTLRFGVELPFYRRQKQLPLVAAAEEDLAAARADVRAAEAAARATAAELAARFAAADEQVRRYREGILPQTSAAVDAARASYLAGRGDFTTAIQDFQLWLDARTELAGREADRFAALAELAEIAGPITGSAPGTAAPVPGGLP